MQSMERFECLEMSLSTDLTYVCFRNRGTDYLLWLRVRHQPFGTHDDASHGRTYQSRLPSIDVRLWRSDFQLMIPSFVSDLSEKYDSKYSFMLLLPQPLGLDMALYLLANVELPQGQLIRRNYVISFAVRTPKCCVSVFEILTLPNWVTAHVTIPCLVCIQVLWLPWDTTPLYFGPRSPQHAELYGDCLHAWGTWEHVKPWHSVRMPQLSFWIVDLLHFAPSSHVGCWSFAQALILNCSCLAMCKCPQLSFWIVHLLRCAHTLSLHFLCNVHR